MDQAMLTKIYQQIPPPPPKSAFHLEKVTQIALPHPYCITPKHVAVAADHHCGILDSAAIEDAEQRGASCDTCKELVRKRRQDHILKHYEHENQVTLVVIIPKGIRDLNAIPGLHAYLLSIKDLATALGVQGFAFPSREGQV